MSFTDLQTLLSDASSPSIVNFNGCSILGTETLTIPAGKTLIISSGQNLINDGTIDNNGIIYNRGTIDNEVGGIINNYNGGTIHNEYGGIINNVYGGIINNDNGGTIYNRGEINNNGTIDNNDRIDNGGTIDNSGRIINNDNGGTIIDNYYGTIYNRGGGIIYNGDRIHNYYGAIDNRGTIDNNGGTIDNKNNGGTIDNNGGTIYNRGRITNYYVGTITNYNGGTINNSGRINNVYGGIINNDNGGTIDNLGTIDNGGVGGTIDNGGGIITNGGTIDNKRVIYNYYGGNIDNYGTTSGTVPIGSGAITGTLWGELPPVITLLGDATVTIEIGSTYTEELATALDNYGGDITSSITTISTVDTSTVGTYTVIYNVTDANGNVAAPIERTVNVVDTTIPVITLLGDATVTIEVNDTYADAGATASDTYDGNITDSIVDNVGTVDTSTVGTYTVIYNVTDANGNVAVEVVRTVNVVDTTNPVITLKGGSTVIIKEGDTYTDEGATALDNYDGDITSSITTISTVDTSTVGTYKVTYNVTDANGNVAVEVVRTVNVLFTINNVLLSKMSTDISDLKSSNSSLKREITTIIKTIHK